MKKQSLAIPFILAIAARAAETAEKAPESAVADGVVKAPSLMHRIGEFFRQVFTQDMVFSKAAVAHGLLWIAIVTLCLLSGAIAVQIARRKRRHPLLFFLAGGLLPVMAPLALWLAVPEKQPGAPEKEEPAQPAEEPWDGVMNQPYFKRIALKNDGTPNGPWMIAYNGSRVEMLEIIETEAEFMKARIRNHAGEVVTARIPYAKIESLTELPTDTIDAKV